MIYQPGDTFTLSDWDNVSAPLLDDIEIDGEAYYFDGDTLTPSDTPDAAWTGTRTGGTLGTDSLALQLSVPAAITEAYLNSATRGPFYRRISISHRDGSSESDTAFQASIDLHFTDGAYAGESFTALDTTGRLLSLQITPNGGDVYAHGETLAGAELKGSIPNLMTGALGCDTNGRLWVIGTVVGTSLDSIPYECFVSDDRGRNWTPQNLPPEITPVEAMDYAPSVAMRMSPGRFGLMHFSSAAINGYSGGGQLLWRGASWEYLGAPSPAATLPPGMFPQGAGFVGLFQNFRIVTQNRIVIQAVAVAANNYRYFYDPNSLSFETRAGPPRTPTGINISFVRLLFDNARQRLHAADGIGFWHSSDDMGRTWTNRAL